MIDMTWTREDEILHQLRYDKELMDDVEKFRIQVEKEKEEYENRK